METDFDISRLLDINSMYQFYIMARARIIRDSLEQQLSMDAQLDCV